MTRCTVLKTNNQHRDPTKASPTFTKQFLAADGFVIERIDGGAFLVTHAKAAYALGIGVTEVLEWQEAAFMPGIAKAEEKRSRDKVA
jgi:hypothetical protein